MSALSTETDTTGTAVSQVDSNDNDKLNTENSSPALPVTTQQTSKSPRRSLSQRLDHACQNLTASFFSLNMGTGITSILLYNLPYNAEWLKRLGEIIFVLNVLIFILLSLGSLTRYARYRGVFGALANHLVAGMFWGCLPMGLATIVNMMAYVCVPAWGWRWAQLALGLWWIDVVLSIVVNFGMIFMMFTRHQHSATSMSAVWLLPIVSSVVAAASGGVVAQALLPFSTSLASSTLVASYVVWGTGVPLACFIITLWIFRTATGGVPPPAAMCSVFLPLGPCGQGSFGIILLGRTVRTLAYAHQVGITIDPIAGNTTNAMYRVADAIYAGGLVTGLVLWGLGLCWYILAFAIVFDHWIRNRDFFSLSKFSVALWAITFPIGVFATATSILATELDSPAFKVIATFLSVQVTLHWIYVSFMTVWKVCDGTIFVAAELGVKPPVRRWGGGEAVDEKV